MTIFISLTTFFVVSITSLISLGILIGINYFDYDKNLIISTIGSAFTALSVLIMIIIYFTWKIQRRTEKRHDAFIGILSTTISNMHIMSDVFSHIIMFNKELMENDNENYIESLRKIIEENRESKTVVEYRRLINDLELTEALIDKSCKYDKFQREANEFKTTFHICNFFNIGTLYANNMVEIMVPYVHKYPDEYPKKVVEILNNYQCEYSKELGLRYFVNRGMLNQHLRDLQALVRDEMEMFNKTIKHHISTVN